MYNCHILVVYKLIHIEKLKVLSDTVKIQLDYVIRFF